NVILLFTLCAFAAEARDEPTEQTNIWHSASGFPKVGKQSLTKNLVQQRLAVVELALSKLDTDYEETTYRQNQLVSACIKSAHEELEEAFEQMYAENLQRAFNL